MVPFFSLLLLGPFSAILHLKIFVKINFLKCPVLKKTEETCRNAAISWQSLCTPDAIYFQILGLVSGLLGSSVHVSIQEMPSLPIFDSSLTAIKL